MSDHDRGGEASHARLASELDAYRSPIALRLLGDCEAMAAFASDNGLAIPQWLGNALAKIGARSAPLRRRLDELEAAPEPDEARLVEGRRRLGAAVREDLRGLARIHGVLAELVDPATPRSIRATAFVGGFWDAVRKVPLIGQMMAIAVLFLAGYVGLGMLEGHTEWEEDLRYLNLLCAAGLGASFYSLFTAHRYVVAGSYDPKYTVVYWSRLCLGLIAGVILGGLVFAGADGSSALTAQGGDDQASTIVLGTSLIALLGGYSAEAVNKILRRLSDMLVTFARGDVEQILEAREQALKAELRTQAGEERLRTAATLIDLRAQLAAGQSDRAEQRLEEVLGDLLAGDGDG